ncbi:MAG: polysaccharide deacetylase family protein [Muribaculaceae bacterium]|nr:polysaccharide deacetylase family protein [Muribaculaceae bacterium]
MLLPQERIPAPLRRAAFLREVLFRCDPDVRAVYLTFDDGPIPESTPHLLKMLAAYGARATFFMVADNARRYPELHRAVLEAGHGVGNHTYHHVPPMRQTVNEMMEDVGLADGILHSRLFRPPHGIIGIAQQKALVAAGYLPVMFDLNVRDYHPGRTATQIVDTVRRHVRPGCILNFHDSLKSIDKLQTALPEILRMLRDMDYRMDTL